MNARISKLVDDKYYELLKGQVGLAKVWLSLFHHQNNVLAKNINLTI